MTMTKKALIAGSFLAATAVTGTAMAGAPVIYGKALLTLENQKSEQGATTTVDAWKIESNASRIGVKGKHEIGNGLSAFYKAEFEIYFDDGDKGGNASSETFVQRNIYAGLGGSFGAVQVGKFDTPLKAAQGKFDRFGDLKSDIKHTMVGEDRESNLIQYTSPTIADSVKLKVALQPGEGKDTDGDGKVDKGVADNFAASVEYKTDGLFVALAQQNGMKSKSQSGLKGGTKFDTNYDVTRLVAVYAADNFSVGGLYQVADNATLGSNEEQTSYGLSGSIAVGADVTIEAQYTMTEVDNHASLANGTEVSQITLGAEKKLNKRTKVFGYLSSASQEETGVADVEEDVLGLGIEVKF